MLHCMPTCIQFLGNCPCGRAVRAAGRTDKASLAHVRSRLPKTPTIAPNLVVGNLNVSHGFCPQTLSIAFATSDLMPPLLLMLGAAVLSTARISVVVLPSGNVVVTITGSKPLLTTSFTKSLTGFGLGGLRSMTLSPYQLSPFFVSHAACGAPISASSSVIVAPSLAVSSHAALISSRNVSISARKSFSSFSCAISRFLLCPSSNASKRSACSF